MAGTSDKARFYLEQSVPELQELAKKEIFTSVGQFLSDDCHAYNSRMKSLPSRRNDQTLNTSSTHEAPVQGIGQDMRNMR